MWNYWNYTTLVLQREHAYAFCSCRNSGNASHYEFNCFYVAYPRVHILSILSTFGLLVSKEGMKEGTMVCSIFPFPSMTSFLYKWLANIGGNSTKGYTNNVLGLSYFLKYVASFLCSKQVIGSVKAWSLSDWLGPSVNSGRGWVNSLCGEKREMNFLLNKEIHCCTQQNPFLFSFRAHS